MIKLIKFIVFFIIGLYLIIYGFRKINKQYQKYLLPAKTINTKDFVYNIFLFMLSTITSWILIYFGSFLIIASITLLYDFLGIGALVIMGLPALLFGLKNIIMKIPNYFLGQRNKSIIDYAYNIFLFLFSTIFSWYLIFFGGVLMLLPLIELMAILSKYISI